MNRRVFQIGALAAVIALAVALLVVLFGKSDSEKATPSASPSSYDPRSTTTSPTPTMSTAPPAPSVETDPQVTAAPTPPVGESPAETAIPWTSPIPLPADISGTADPGLAYSPPAVPAALASSFGQVAYSFTIAWSQLYVNRGAWLAEWSARWSPYATEDFRASAEDAAQETWKGPLVYGVITYNPVVTAVVVRADGPHNALFEIVVATQGCSVTTLTPDMAYAHVKIWQVALTVVNGQPKVTAVVRLDEEEEELDAAPASR